MKHHNMHKHSSIWMILICILPMGLIFLLPAFGVHIGFFWLLIPLLCAGSHFLMMRGMVHDDHQGEHGNPHKPPDGKEETS